MTLTLTFSLAVYDRRNVVTADTAGRYSLAFSLISSDIDTWRVLKYPPPLLLALRQQ